MKAVLRYQSAPKRLHCVVAMAIGLSGLSASAQVLAAERGIPINDQLTINKCGGCHVRDATGIMRRLSYMRTTPEVWEESIKRMVRLNGVSIKPAEAHEILRYLSANNGLAPEEAKPIFWEAEHRLFRDQSDKIPDDALQHTCNYCHTIGRVLGQRRTRDDYEKLVSMHVGLFPGSENQFRPRRITTSVAEPPVSISSPPTGYPAVMATASPAPPIRTDGRDPVDIAVDYLSKKQPLNTPEWDSWKASMRNPQLTGKWMLIGYQQGKGRVFGTVVIQAGAAPGDFNTKTDLEYASTGTSLSRTGKGVVYTGYSWRGRSTGTKAEPASVDPSTDPKEWREAMFVARDGNTMDGRWFWGGYQEFGIDAHLIRIGTEPMLAGASSFSIRSPSTQTLKLFGENISANLKPADLNFGPGIRVKRVVKAAGSYADVELEVDSGLLPGARDITLGRSTAERAVAIYDKVAYIKVLPDASMARLGGTIAAKQFAQFEAVAYSAGADGKPNTEDDIPIGPISARWGLEEFISTSKDNDVKFVGRINDNGLFTPNLEGPNPERKEQANNYPTNNWGDVWVTATYDQPGASPMKAKSYLVVTIPVYMKYDQPEVSQ